MSPDEIKVSKEKLGIQEPEKEIGTIQHKRGIWARIKELFGFEGGDGHDNHYSYWVPKHGQKKSAVVKEEFKYGIDKSQKVSGGARKEQYRDENCFFCHRKFKNWTDSFRCKCCGWVYCSDCRVPETHECSYIYGKPRRPPGGLIERHNADGTIRASG